MWIGCILFSGAVQGETAEQACRQFDGDSQCEKPLNPVATNDFFYIMRAGDWGTVYGTGNTAEEAASGFNNSIPGPNPPFDCETCNILGQGNSSSPLLGRTRPSISRLEMKGEAGITPPV